MRPSWVLVLGEQLCVQGQELLEQFSLSSFVLLDSFAKESKWIPVSRTESGDC